MTRIIKARSVSIIFLDRFLNISAKNIQYKLEYFGL